jgi:hypothetical protein
MACSLTPSLGEEDFTAPTGATVTLELRGPARSGAEIVHLRYDQTALDDEEPFQFTVKRKQAMLVVVAEASKPGVLLFLVEICDEDGSEQIIDRFNYDPMNPARGYLVQGD